MEGDTAANAEGTKNIFDKLFPSATVAQLVFKPIASDFKSKLLLLPDNYARGKRKQMSSEKLIALGRTLPPQEKMQGATVNKHIRQPDGVLAHLVRQKKIPADIPNPFIGLHIVLKKGRKARNERYNWTRALEKALFESPIYTGCSSIHRRATGNEIHQDALFWMPLLARTMGTRQNETCDALVGDVKVEEPTKDRFRIWKLLMARTSARKDAFRLPTSCLGWAFLNNGWSVVILRALVSRINPTGPRKAQVRGIYRPVCLLQKGDEDLSTPRGFSFVSGQRRNGSQESARDQSGMDR